jgi:hypothetical protein
LPTTQDQVVQAGLSRRRAFADVVLSDMLQNTSGRHDLDHFRSMDLCHEALAFCDTLLRPGGTFVAKYLRGQVSGWRLGASSPWLVFTLDFDTAHNGRERRSFWRTQSGPLPVCVRSSPRRRAQSRPRCTSLRRRSGGDRNTRRHTDKKRL